MKKSIDSKTRQHARELRRCLSPFERRLWSRLRGRKLLGLHVRRQHPIGPYIVDFFISRAKLVIELDGLSHNERVDEDRVRDKFLRASGYRVVRIANQDVREHLDAVVKYLEELCRHSL